MTEPALLGLTCAEAAELDDSHRIALLGAKGAALARMTELGLRVPPGFILTTSACRMVLEHGWSSALDDELAAGVSWIEQQLDRRFGDPGAPLLVSVRSGAPVSMPGMTDTVLNVGVTEAVAEALSERSGNGLFGWDTARRFVQSYASVVAGAPADLAVRLSAPCLRPNDGQSPCSVALAAATRQLREEPAAAGHSMPDDPEAQLQQSAQAVFASWTSEASGPVCRGVRRSSQPAPARHRSDDATHRVGDDRQAAPVCGTSRRTGRGRCRAVVNLPD